MFNKINLGHPTKIKRHTKIKSFVTVIKVLLVAYVLASTLYATANLVSYVKTLRVSASIISVAER